jgi:hypothetical protein
MVNVYNHLGGQVFRSKEVLSYLSIVTKGVTWEKVSQWSTWPHELKFILVSDMTFGKLEEIKINNLYSITFLLRYLDLSGLGLDMAPIMDIMKTSLCERLNCVLKVQ